MDLPRLAVIIPTLNAADRLAPCLRALAATALRPEVLVVDGGSTDDTVAVAASHGIAVVTSPPGRGRQLATGADTSDADWLLFLHADTVLEAGWDRALAAFITDPARQNDAATFVFALDDPAPVARRLERFVGWRTRALALPYGDQGLAISRRAYRRLGGFRPLPIMEDVDFIRRIPAGRLHVLPARAVTSARRYRHGGYVARPLRNLFCQALWRAGLPADMVARLYR